MWNWDRNGVCGLANPLVPKVCGTVINILIIQYCENRHYKYCGLVWMVLPSPQKFSSKN